MYVELYYCTLEYVLWKCQYLVNYLDITKNNNSNLKTSTEICLINDAYNLEDRNL